MSDVMVPYVERTIDGEVVKFGKLSIRDRARILKRLKDERRPKFIETLERAKKLYVEMLKGTTGIDPAELLDKAGLSAQEYINEVDAFDQQAMGVDDLFRYLKTPEGQAEVIQLGIEKQNAGRADAIMEKLVLEDADALQLAADMSCIKILFAAPGNSSGNVAASGGGSQQEGEKRPSVPAS